MKTHVSRIATSLLLVAVLVLAGCSRAQVASRADKVSFAAGAFAAAVQQYPGLAKKAEALSKDSGKLAEALRAGAANSVELAANLVDLIDDLEIDVVDAIPAGWKRTAVMVALAAVEDVLRDVANDLIAAADTYRDSWNPLISSFVQQVEKSKSADTLRVFAKKPKLRCRDAKSGRFLKMEKCKESPETTVVERVKK